MNKIKYLIIGFIAGAIIFFALYVSASLVGPDNGGGPSIPGALCLIDGDTWVFCDPLHTFGDVGEPIYSINTDELIAGSGGITTTGTGTFGYVNITDEGEGYQVDGNLILTNEGTANIFVGEGTTNTDVGRRNTFLGSEAGYYNTRGTGDTGTYNTYIGDRAGYGNTTENLGYYNVAVGAGALGGNTTGYEITAIGVDALLKNSTGYYNVGVGTSAGFRNETGDENTIIGYEAGYGSSGSSYGANTLIGYQAGYSMESSDNTAIGYKALYSNAGGSGGNTAIGEYALYAVTTGTENIAIGYEADDTITTGSNNIIIGIYQDAPASDTSNHLNIGGAITGDLSAGDITIANDLTVTGELTAATLIIDSNTVNLSDTTDGYVLAFDTGTDTWRGVVDQTGVSEITLDSQCDGSTTTFTLGRTIKALVAVNLNGTFVTAILNPAKTQITLAFAPDSGEELKVIALI